MRKIMPWLSDFEERTKLVLLREDIKVEISIKAAEHRIRLDEADIARMQDCISKFGDKNKFRNPRKSNAIERVMSARRASPGMFSVFLASLKYKAEQLFSALNCWCCLVLSRPIPVQYGSYQFLSDQVLVAGKLLEEEMLTGKNSPRLAILQELVFELEAHHQATDRRFIASMLGSKPRPLQEQKLEKVRVQMQKRQETAEQKISEIEELARNIVNTPKAGWQQREYQRIEAGIAELEAKANPILDQIYTSSSIDFQYMNEKELRKTLRTFEEFSDSLDLIANWHKFADSTISDAREKREAAALSCTEHLENALARGDKATIEKFESLAKELADLHMKVEHLAVDKNAKHEKLTNVIAKVEAAKKAIALKLAGESSSSASQ